MATGDFQFVNNMRKLRKGLKLIQMADDVDMIGLTKGVPSSFLPIYHYLFTMFSPQLAENIVEKGIELFGKSDLKFIEGVYKVLRDMFDYKPPLTREQFFSSSFAEKKIVMCCEILDLVYSRSLKLRARPQKTKTSANTKPPSRPTAMVGFKRMPASSVLQRADSFPPDSRDMHGVSDRSLSRQSSHSSSCRSTISSSGRPASAKQSVYVAEELPNNPVNRDCLPKTPGIRKMTPSSVHVEYVPRAEPSQNKAAKKEMPIKTKVKDCVNTADQRRAEEQLNIQIPQQKVSTLKTSECVQASSEKKCTCNCMAKVETIDAKVLLLANRMSIIESKLDSLIRFIDQPVVTQHSLQGQTGEIITAVTAPSNGVQGNGHDLSVMEQSGVLLPPNVHVNAAVTAPSNGVQGNGHDLSGMEQSGVLLPPNVHVNAAVTAPSNGVQGNRHDLSGMEQSGVLLPPNVHVNAAVTAPSNGVQGNGHDLSGMEQSGVLLPPNFHVNAAVTAPSNGVQGNGHDLSGMEQCRVLLPPNVHVNEFLPSPILRAQEIDKNGHVAEAEFLKNTAIANVDHCNNVRNSTPTEKTSDISLTSTYIDQSTREKAERLKAMLQDTNELLITAGHFTQNILNENKDS